MHMGTRRETFKRLRDRVPKTRAAAASQPAIRRTPNEAPSCTDYASFCFTCLSLPDPSEL